VTAIDICHLPVTTVTTELLVVDSRGAAALRIRANHAELSGCLITVVLSVAAVFVVDRRGAGRESWGVT
jgi:hypothetical protein